MKAQTDALYAIFEQHLHNALVEEESAAEFVARVVQEYLACLTKTAFIPHAEKTVIEEDLREEVMEMLRKKTYGFFSLKTFREAKSGQGTQAATPAPAPAAPVAVDQHAKAAQSAKSEASAPPTASQRTRPRRARRAN